MSDAARLKSTIHVGGLDPSITRDMLHQAFLPFGEIVSLSLPLDERSHNPTTTTSTDPNNPTAPHRGFCLIEYEIPPDAHSAIDNMDQSMLLGRVLRVSQAKPQKDPNEGLGSRVAVWEQEGWLARNEVSEEDRIAAEEARVDLGRKAVLVGLEGEVVGPEKPPVE